MHYGRSEVFWREREDPLQLLQLIDAYDLKEKLMKKAFITIAFIALLNQVCFADIVIVGTASQNKKMIFENVVLSQIMGKEIPLEFALNLIAGNEVDIDLGTNVNKDTIVSFRDGRPRGEILNELLSPLGLHWKVRANILEVRTTRELELEKQYGPAGVSLVTHKYIWKIPKDTTLKKLLASWCKEVGYGLSWKPSVDYKIVAAATIEGDFKTAIRTVILTMKNVQPPINVTVWDRNHVVTVE